MLNDLKSPSSSLYKAVDKVERDRMTAAGNAYNLKKIASDATLAKANAAAAK